MPGYLLPPAIMLCADLSSLQFCLARATTAHLPAQCLLPVLAPVGQQHRTWREEEEEKRGSGMPLQTEPWHRPHISFNEQGCLCSHPSSWHFLTLDKA